ncbi:MAG TPA: Gfo/Idh/MocA family oxidoreductase [Cyclobacteriaceae bacterium]|nr:Gfo/Idh/MocA family oxidoreductase [Cyclobacteriaceae bacterium]
MKKIRWGILGCGRIARKFASDLRLVADAELVAVGARELSTAESFAKEFPAKHVHGSYDALVSNPEVDVIYVATPHGLHHQHVLLCLQHKKAVLCEKAFALNFRQAHEMIELAKRQKVFLMEAFWTRLLPHYVKAKQLIEAGKVG